MHIFSKYSPHGDELNVHPDANHRHSSNTFATIITLATTIYIGLFLALPSAHAARVQFHTFLGDIEVDLFDQQTPIASDAFLSLVDNGVFDNSIIHRIDNNRLMEGGLYSLANGTLSPISNLGVTRSEVLFSNVRGTLAYADPAQLSASLRSVQWFINLCDNSDILDRQNGGYTVFGRVSDAGMAVVDAIAQLEKLSFEGFPDLPLRHYSAQDALNGEVIAQDNYALIKRVVILDNTETSDIELPPLILQATPSPGVTSENDDVIEGIGALNSNDFWAFLMLILIKRRSGVFRPNHRS